LINNSQKLVSESMSSPDQLFTSQTHQKVRVISDELFSWMSAREFKGWDPFDALNSPLLKGVSGINRCAGQAALQLVKRSPINLRRALLVPKTINAKGLGLILMALIIRYRLNRQDEDMHRVFQLARWLKEHQSKGYSGACWGYPFDWPNRAFYAPAGTPTIVNTAFIGGSLLDLFEETAQEEWLDLAVSACEFICRDLKRSAGKQGLCFSYTPIDQSRVHNANLLGAALLTRVGKMTGRGDLLELSRQSAAFSIYSQNEDGSWPYGEAGNQKWIDSFHTGYNLMALKDIHDHLGYKEAGDACIKGYSFYLRHFFLSDGTVKYYHDKAEPLDAHAFAHAAICLSDMTGRFETPPNLAEKALSRMIDLFWSGNGYFYWQKQHGFLYRMACMRWVQAWAFLALMKYLESRTRQVH
jgi:hypothetical protein